MANKRDPTITCILTSHRRPGYVDELIASVLTQTYPHWRLVVVDSGTLLGAGHFDYLTDPRILVVPQQTAGRRTPSNANPQSWSINDCFHRGLVSGDLVCYASDDDKYYPGAFAAFATAACNMPQINAWYGSFDRANGNCKIGQLVARHIGNTAYSLNCIADGMQVCHRSSARVLWPEDLSVSRNADGVFLDRLGRLTPILPLPVTIGLHRCTPHSTFSPATLIYPSDVRGWLTPAEAQTLWRLAHRQRVLEIGSFCGLSTICMAQLAREVHAIDPFNGSYIGPVGSFAASENTYAEFVDNLRRYGVGEYVVIHYGQSADILPTLAGPFGLVFIDGAHDEANVRRDVELTLPLLSAGGVLAFHDYSNPDCPDVKRVVDELTARKGVTVTIVDQLATINFPALSF